ncbi:unnamed protein product [Spirodela intermedia]|uniref:Uncharacterized protein n=1 Tax=Spirodela intermedia TaxID=51605 RepID=A0A7I8L4G5_SPIIN|nr:unnamed protein product [Spirodela intermedia]
MCYANIMVHHVPHHGMTLSSSYETFLNLWFVLVVSFA